MKGYFKDDLEALISDHLSNVDSKLTAMSDSIVTVAVESEQLQKVRERNKCMDVCMFLICVVSFYEIVIFL